MAHNRSHIVLTTEVPGPKSRGILERLKAAVPEAIAPYAPVVVERAEGTLLTDVDGNTFIDLTGGIGVLNVGHVHPTVVAAVQEQSRRFLHTDFTVVPYENYIALAERLNRRFPGRVRAKTAFFNSGAEAVENAVKIARAATGRPAVIAFERAFHGRTLLTMSLTSKTHPYKAGMGPFAPEVYRLPYPYPYRCPHAGGEAPHVCDETCFEPIERAFELAVAPEEVAAIVAEPVQGEGGFVVPPPAFFPWLKALAERHGILLICDEVQSGFGRTGKFFAIEHFGVVPDLITVAKSIAAGLPLSAVIGRAEVMDAPAEGQLGGTYVGNPVAVAAAHAVLDLFESEDFPGMAVRMGQRISERLESLRPRVPQIGNVRGLGAMVGVELVEDPRSKRPAPEFTGRVLRRALDRGVICLRAGVYENVIRFLAPLNTSEAVLDEALDVLCEVLTEEAGARPTEASDAVEPPLDSLVDGSSQGWFEGRGVPRGR